MGAINNSINLNDRMTPVLRSIMKALDSTLVAMASVDKVSQKAFQQATRDAQNATKAINNFRTSLTQTQQPAKQGFLNVIDGSSQAESAVDGLIGKIRTLIGAYLGFQGVSNLVSGGDTFIGNVARLDLMNDGLQTTTQLQQQIYEASQRSLANYNEMTAAVAKLGITANHAFGSSKEIVAFTELLNKQFSIAGASQSEKAGAMYQLTQAMASGRLQGDEFRSILENAPMLAKTIADSMGLTYKQMKEASTKGEITSEIIKKALFSVAEETNKKFAEMPMKFGDLWMQVVNKITKGLEPVYIKLRDMWNNKEFQVFIDGFTNGIAEMLGYTVKFIEVVSKVGVFVAKQWDFIAPVIFGVVYALGALITAHLIYAAITGASALASAVYTAWLDIQKGSTFAAAAAQYGLNAALLACPITWIILGIMAVIGILYLVVAWINKTKDETWSATGMIVGLLKGAVAVIWNIILALGEFIFGIFTGIWNFIAMFANFFANVFKNPIAAGVAAFQAFALAILNIIGGIAKAIDTVFGSNLYESVEGWKSGVKTVTNKVLEDAAKEGKYEEVMPVVDKTLEELGGFKRMGYMDSMVSGYFAGAGAVEDVQDMFKVGDKTYNMDDQFFKDMQADLAKTSGNTALTAENTGKLADGVNLADDDIELLKEHARVSFVNRFTTMTPNISASFGDVRETADVKGIIEMLKKSIRDALEESLR